MVLSAHQPCYLPWLGFLNKIINSDLFVILDSVQFEKGSYINRTKIKTAQGEHWLTVPVGKDSYKKKIYEVTASDNTWTYKHCILQYDNYRDAEHFRPMVNPQPEHYLIHPILNNIKALLKGLRISTPLAYQIDLNIEGEKQELIINLCKHYNADAFLFGAKGRDYVDVDYFRSHGIEPLFQDFKCIEYPQQWGGEFIPGLSVIDALFNVGSEKTLELIKGGYSVR